MSLGLGLAGPLLLGWAAVATAAPPPSKLSSTRSIYAQRVEAGAIRIDGRLDEDAWAQAPVGMDFVERVPTPGATPPVQTEVRVLAAADRLYIAVTAHLLPGETPRALELRRDSLGIFSDDAISLKLDVRHDTRTTVGFVTNPAGNQLDYVAVENSEGFRREFDAIWDVATSVEPDRWIAEFELPAVALGLPESSDGLLEGRAEALLHSDLQDEPSPELGQPPSRWRRIIGLNVTRDHNARLATYDWSPIPPEFGPTSALFYGDLFGTDPLGGGRPLSLIPYVLGAYESVGRPSWRGRAGGDARLRIAEDIFFELTVLTDFAQVDLDDPVVNLERFPLFFPERRPFFLSGIEFYDVGASGEAQLYFSRRIGLDDEGRTIPLLGGAKAYGTADDFRFGALYALTDEEGERPAQSFSVLRARQNFGENGHLGLIGTLRSDVGLLSTGATPTDPRVSLGVDGGARAFDRRLQASGFLAMTTAPDDPSIRDGLAGQANLQWIGYHVQPEISLLVVSPEFAPAVGFVRRTDQVAPSVYLTWITRTTDLGLQQITVETGGTVVYGYRDGEVQTQTATGEIDVLLRSNFGLNLYAEATEDVVPEAIEVAGFAIQPGRYRGALFVATLISPGGRNPTGSLTYAHNTGFFGGIADTFSGFLELRAGPHVQLTLAGDLSLLDFGPRGRRTTLTPSVNLTFAFDTRIQLDLVGQANTFEERATALARLRWRYLPGSDLFFVYREDLEWPEGDLRGKRSLTLKVSYRFDTLL